MSPHVNTKDEIGRTPLHYAAYDGHKEIVERLIANGADIKAKDKGGFTPLDLAVSEGKKETVALLSKHGGKTAAELKGKQLK